MRGWPRRLARPQIGAETRLHGTGRNGRSRQRTGTAQTGPHTPSPLQDFSGSLGGSTLSGDGSEAAWSGASLRSRVIVSVPVSPSASIQDRSIVA